MVLTRFQKIILAALAGMLLFFGGLMAVFRAHPGVPFEDGLLKITEQEGQTLYSGTAYGTPVSISVAWPSNFLAVVDFTIGTEIHDVCEMEYPLAPIQTNFGPVSGIRITKNGTLLFQGAYEPEINNGLGWFDQDGEWASWVFGRAEITSDIWRSYETTKEDVLRFALGPETSAHGEPTLFALAVFFSILLAVRVVFWRQFFRFGHRWARDPEPSEGYQLLAGFFWAVAAGVIAILYLAAMVKIG